MKIFSYCGQLTLCVLGIIGIIVYFVLRKKYSSGSKKKNSLPYNLVVFVFIPVVWALSINLTVSWLQDKVIVTSVLDYPDVINILIPFGCGIYIAYFQYKIQKQLEEKNEAEANDAKNRQAIAQAESDRKMEMEKELAVLRHKNELISDRIRSTHFLSNNIMTCINYNISLASLCLENNLPTYRIIIDNPNMNYSVFYHPYCSCDIVEMSISPNDGDIIDLDKDYINNNVFLTPYKLQLDLRIDRLKEVSNEKISLFMLYPAQRKKNVQIPKIVVSLKLELTDKSLVFEDNKPLIFSYGIRLVLTPSKGYGYAQNGSFNLELDMANLE